MLKYFYKIEDNKLIKGSGYKIPDGFIEFIKGNEPEEFRQLNKIHKLNTISNELRSKYNKERDILTDNIIVTLSSGVKLDGNEKSQDRLTRVLSCLTAKDTIDWIDANNNQIRLTKAQVKECLTLAGLEQTKLFLECNSKKANIQVEAEQILIDEEGKDNGK